MGRVPETKLNIKFWKQKDEKGKNVKNIYVKFKKKLKFNMFIQDIFFCRNSVYRLSIIIIIINYLEENVYYLEYSGKK